MLIEATPTQQQLVNCKKVFFLAFSFFYFYLISDVTFTSQKSCHMPFRSCDFRIAQRFLRGYLGLDNQRKLFENSFGNEMWQRALTDVHQLDQ